MLLHNYFDFIPILRHHNMVMFPKGTVADNGRCGRMTPILPIMGVGGKTKNIRKNL